MTPVVSIRPRPGCDATLAAAAAMGLEAYGFPLFEISPHPWQPPDPADIDALLIGSANALRHAGEALHLYHGKPVYAVGETTAEAARSAGFEVMASGSGGLQALLAQLHPDHRRLLRLAGEARVDIAAPPGVGIAERTVYASVPLPMPEELAALLRRPAVVLLHSGEAARHFAYRCSRHGIDRSRLALVAIGPRVAAAAGEGWQAVATAEEPKDAALLALARRMCQTAPEAGRMEDGA